MVHNEYVEAKLVEENAEQEIDLPVGPKVFARSGVIACGWTGDRNLDKIAVQVDAESKHVGGEIREWTRILELQLKARSGSDVGVAFSSEFDVVERGQRMIHAGSSKHRKGTLPNLYCLPPPPEAAASVLKRYAEKGREQMFRELLVVPLDHVDYRIAKFDVCLREEPLFAVHAYRTVLERMVMFDWNMSADCANVTHAACETRVICANLCCCILAIDGDRPETQIAQRCNCGV